MKTYKVIVAAVIAATSLVGHAQTALDAMAISQYDLRGTARFMSMAGAFGALGGDMSVLNQNPGGIGIYRSSEIGATLDIGFHNSTTKTQGFNQNYNMTKADCNNFGYVGAISTGSELMPYFNWGVNYTRAASFNRRFKGTIGTLNGSLTNYVAGYTSAEQWPSNDLNGFSNSWNPYEDTTAPWMSVLFYNSYLINPIGSSQNDGIEDEYAGLWKDGTSGRAAFDVEERGHIDEYNIDFGGNFQDVVYWGLGFGATDIRYDQSTYYEEDLTNALVANPQADGVQNGNGGFGLDGRRHIEGSGFNFKVGVIVKPINELRLGFAVHTPTYYNLTQYENGAVDYGFSTGYNDYHRADKGYSSRVDWKLHTPWRLMASVAGVIGGQAILSLDYEYRPYQDMTMKNRHGDDYTDYNNDIDTYYKASNILRLGAEYRIDRNWSVRAGYSVESSPVTNQVKDGQEVVYTSGVDDYGMIPSYTLDNKTQYITCGIGYRYQNFYADAAYVNKHKSSTFHPWTPNSYTATPPSSEVSNNVNSLVLSIGFRF